MHFEWLNTRSRFEICPCVDVYGSIPHSKVSKIRCYAKFHMSGSPGLILNIQKAFVYYAYLYTYENVLSLIFRLLRV